jgi:hypothetical protein
MNLQPGCPLVVAPRFYLSIDWSDRLRLGCVEEEAGGFFPGPSWRAPTDDELSVLVGDPSQLTEKEALARGLCLFALPRHLQSAFGTMLEQAAQASGRLEGFDGFVREVARFLDFKGLAVPEGTVFDLLVSRPGQRSVQWDGETGQAVGLTFDLAGWLSWPVPDQARAPRLWGGINMGEEAVSLLFVNRSAEQLQADLACRLPGLSPPATMDELGRRFLTHCPDYPLVRLKIEPGEGYRVPGGGLLIDACTLDVQGPSVMLMVRQEDDPSR